MAAVKARIAASGLSIADLVSTAWDSARTFRGSDKRGGANGARIRLAPQKTGPATSPSAWPACWRCWTDCRRLWRQCESRCDCAGRQCRHRASPQAAGVTVDVPFAPGRGDASAEQTDAESFAVLEPLADGFSQLAKAGLRRQRRRNAAGPRPADAPDRHEMTVLVGGLRVLGANHGGSAHGVFTERVGC